MEDLERQWDNLQIEDEEQGILFEESEVLQDEVDARFCHKLFDEPLESILKPYGVFMKAPDRRNNKQIGGRWLRDSMGQPLMRSFGETGMGNGGRESWKGETKITDTVMIEGVDQGGLRREKGGNNYDNAEVRTLITTNEHLETTEVGIFDLNDKDGVSFIDNK
ncbi:hypothetical protein POM88_001036 [Heracleum sosnowskyi]|uniref:Uncharacterized protein n=1 Tax=Heracleum sosnowskyi TaxID=360622 RepID=A0AAD8NAC2_9APIA|nr:hypothetical protein POM88_001036 [Heracleum sosnowskyi]